MRILLIDDERNINRMLTVALEADGHAVVAVESGTGALRQVQKAPFDAAFLDLRLGQEDGLAVLTQLRRADAGMAVIIVTAFASIANAIEATKLGATDYLPKPFTPEQVRLVLDRVEKKPPPRTPSGRPGNALRGARGRWPVGGAGHEHARGARPGAPHGVQRGVHAAPGRERHGQERAGAGNSISAAPARRGRSSR